LNLNDKNVVVLKSFAKNDLIIYQCKLNVNLYINK